jgi:hypothetical protein
MPTNLVGLLLFVAMLAPGLVYVLRQEGERPPQPLSPFRETVLLALVSVTCNVVVLSLLVPVRVLVPDYTPDVGAMVRDLEAYAVDHYGLLALWSPLTYSILCRRYRFVYTNKVLGRFVDGGRWADSTLVHILLCLRKGAGSCD